MIEYKKAHKLDDLVVSEFTDQVMIGHREDTGGAALCLSLTDFESLNGRQILKRFNAHIDWILDFLDSVAKSRPVEIKHGQPQLQWNKECKKWTAEGHVLRCEVGWNREAGGENGVGAVAIRIDDRLLSGAEFLGMLEAFEGWGMRIEFMHQNRLSNPPEPVLQKSRKEK